MYGIRDLHIDARGTVLQLKKRQNKRRETSKRLTVDSEKPTTYLRFRITNNIM